MPVIFSVIIRNTVNYSKPVCMVTVNSSVFLICTVEKRAVTSIHIHTIYIRMLYVCMHVCMYVFIYVDLFMYAYIYYYIHTIYERKYAPMYVVCMCVYVYVFTCVYVCM